jgi:branched-chain amino acid transport system substrate-binding protein
MGHTLNGAFKLGIGMALVAATLGTSQAADDKIKVGFMLPYTGTYASLGNAITNGFKQFVAEQGGKLGGREIEYYTVDDESDPAKATENANKLVKRDKVTCWSARCTPASPWPWPRSPARTRPC